MVEDSKTPGEERDYNYDYKPDYYLHYRQGRKGNKQGPYTGVGPENYRRTDERIQDEINARLTQHGRIDARNIQVGVSDHIVSLQGTVRSKQEKYAAEDVADSVSGVEDVFNDLKVEGSPRRQ